MNDLFPTFPDEVHVFRPQHRRAILRRDLQRRMVLEHPGHVFQQRSWNETCLAQPCENFPATKNPQISLVLSLAKRRFQRLTNPDDSATHDHLPTHILVLPARRGHASDVCFPRWLVLQRRRSGLSQ